MNIIRYVLVAALLAPAAAFAQAPSILPFLLEADRRHPELKTINTAESCFELLQLTIALAGPDWAFVGKTTTMDGAGVAPPGFSPIALTLTRPDGQRQTVQITKLGMDAAWHLPSRRQIKVIANSSANDDPDPGIHGPARLAPYEIDPHDYRWHNPPIPQFGNVAPPLTLPPVVAPPPACQACKSIPGYAGDDAFDRVGAVLFADYAEAGQAPNEGMARWMARTIYDWIAGVTTSLQASIDKHRVEWRAALGVQQ